MKKNVENGNRKTSLDPKKGLCEFQNFNFNYVFELNVKLTQIQFENLSMFAISNVFFTAYECNSFLGSISPTFYEQLLWAQIPKAQKRQFS